MQRKPKIFRRPRLAIELRPFARALNIVCFRTGILMPFKSGLYVSDTSQPQISVVMPTYNQGAFLRRAVLSLLGQTYTNWELLIVDDGSTDDTPDVIAGLLPDARIRQWRLPKNRGLGYALNFGLEVARSPLISYLPSDDRYFPNHLESLKSHLSASPEEQLAYSGVRFHQRRTEPGQIHGWPLQLVQVMHRCRAERWTERKELVSDDLERLFWGKLRTHGTFGSTGTVSCEWVDHPRQHHKSIRENMGGGVNPYRSRYNVEEPLKFQSSIGSYTNEETLYGRFRERPDTPAASDTLKILFVGELAFNPERVLALEERGHRLYGLWMENPWWLNTVGPLPFGHVTDIPRANWRNAVRELQPDVIYGLLNWQAVPFVHEVLRENLDIPFVWHFKEGPWLCLEHGSWPQMMDLHTKTDGQIYTSPELRSWFETILPGAADHGRTMILDGDLPKREWFDGKRSARLSASDGEFHTVVPGRPIGLHPGLLRDLAKQRIHLHFYGDLQHRDWGPWVEEARRVADGYFHLHPHVGPAQWVSELSRYDAGWLHFLKSENDGEIASAFWDDLNYPARMTTLLAAGLPLIQYDNQGAIVATQNLARRLDIGLFCRDMEELGEQFRNTKRFDAIRENVEKHRRLFTFDYHADDLVAFFRRVIAKSGRGDNPMKGQSAGGSRVDNFVPV